MKKLGNSGISSLLMIMVIAGSLMVLFSSMGNMFQSLNKTTTNLKTHGTYVGVLMDMAQMISQAYARGRATSGACDASSTPYLVSGTIYLCLPNQQYCSQNGTKFCLKSPADISQFKEKGKEVYVVQSSRVNRNWKIENLILPRAMAAPPTPGLPDIAATTPPTATIAAPLCDNTTGVQRDCIRCDAPNQNAYCFKVRICTTGTSTCTAAGDYIEPVFAITYN